MEDINVWNINVFSKSSCAEAKQKAASSGERLFLTMDRMWQCVCSLPLLALFSFGVLPIRFRKNWCACGFVLDQVNLWLWIDLKKTSFVLIDFSTKQTVKYYIWRHFCPHQSVRFVHSFLTCTRERVLASCLCVGLNISYFSSLINPIFYHLYMLRPTWHAGCPQSNIIILFFTTSCLPPFLTRHI